MTREQRCLDHLQARGRLPSVVGGVLRAGSLAWAGGAGDVPGDPVDVQYRIGSITKTMTAVLVLRSRDAGDLSLDDALGRFVPENGYADATLRSLLAHTSGMQSEPAGPWWERSPGVAFADLSAANDGTGAVARAGEYHHYSNLGFALLGEVVARVRGTTWWSAVQDELLDPLAMSRTTYDATAPHADGWSIDHFTGVPVREPHEDTVAMAPAGQAWSTVRDLATWAVFLRSGHPEVVSRETLDEMARPSAPAPEYGLGLRLVPRDAGHLRGHTGSMPGFLASLFIDPTSGDGAVLLANATTGIVTDEVPALLLGTDDVEPVEPWRPTTALPREVDGVPGLWFWGNSAFELRWTNDRLETRSLALQNRQDVFEVRDGRIVGVDGYHRGETLHVVRRPDGTVDHLECATFVYTAAPYA